MKMTKLFSIAVVVGSIFVGQNAFAQNKMMNQETKMVGGAEMYPTRTL